MMACAWLIVSMLPILLMVINNIKANNILFVTDTASGTIWTGPVATLQLQSVPLQDAIQRPMAVDYDPVEGQIYWTDTGLYTISRAFLNGTGQEVIVDGLSDPDGLSLDTENRHMYWTDAGTDTIERADLDGLNRVIISENDHYHLRAIVVDPTGQHIYWTDWGFKNQKIERAKLDGSEREVLVSTGLLYPNGIAISFEDQRIYWCDAGLNLIQSVNLNGGHRVVHFFIFSPDIHPFDIAVYNSSIYWTDWALPNIIELPYGSLEAMLVGPGIFEQASGLHIHQEHDGSCSNNQCQNNATCRQLISGYRCECVIGFTGVYCELTVFEPTTPMPEETTSAPASTVGTLNFTSGTLNLTKYMTTQTVPCDSNPCQNGGSCYNSGDSLFYVCHCPPEASGGNCQVTSQASPVTCEPNEFACHDGLCIPNSYLCDTQFDCIEGEDEFNCTEPFPDCMPSGYNLVRCPGPRNAGCIFDEWFCDQENDCRDGSDEHVAQCGQPQPCDSNLFQCNNSICIQTAWVCDQDNDCGDSSDEMHCPSIACSSTTDFTCANGRCVKLDVLCDGFNDCRDYSDELPRYCPVTEPPLICGSGEILCQGVCVQPRDCQINQCELYPSVCSQICTYDSNARDYTCSCDSGFDLQPDGYTCIAKSTSDKDRVPPMLYFCNKYYIRKTGVNYSPNANGNGTIVGQDFGFVVAFDYDYADQKIYVTDVGAHKIISMNMDGTEKKEIVKGRLHSVEGIAVDWVTKKLYWTDRTYDVLEVANTNGSMRKTLVRENMFEPRGVAVDPRDGYVYWTDWGLNAYIGRIGMDGTDEKELHNDAIVWPNGITIDYPSNKIYWTDAHLDYLAYADLDFNNFHRVLSDARDHTIAHPFSVSVFEDTMYWTDWNEFKLYKANKRDGSRIEVLLSDLPLRPMDIHVVHSHKQATNLPNPCRNDNSGCSHLCLMTPISTPGSTAPGFVCACPDNFVLGTDQKMCIPDCLNTQFLCNSIHRCIDQLWVCDGEEDCPYGEDEKNCTEHRHCDPKYFECSVSHSCIHPNLVCDGKPDCLTDTSDEDNCQNTQCQAWEFRCSTGKCIPHTDVCDQTEDCANGDDEKPEVCQDHRCYDGYFQCSNGFCIPELWVCDLDNDCGDGSDEPFNCATRTCKDGWFACRTNYRCVPGWAVCYGGDHCRDNSDEQDCTLKTCDPQGEFQCIAGGQCVPTRWYCDAESDCPDGSDEPFNCSPRQCSESEHKCDNDRCIPGAWKCDGDFDCGEGDESDEANCESTVCEEGQFKCLDPGYCIAKSLTCDGKAACEDASDELNCPTRFPGGLWCPDDFFTCDTTACIPKWWVCDGENDCTDGSDEKQSYCATVINQCNSEHSRWLCDDGTCILEWERCDNVPHCPDGSDEFPSLCTPDRVCDANTEFDCRNGFCIPISTVCDKRNDCGLTAWDEVGCNNGTCGSNNGGCAQDCIDTTNGYYCECRAGYITDPDRPANCIDFDDCANKPCSQVCYNLKGGYNCACVEGFREDVTRPGEGICLSDGREFVLIGAEKEIIKYYPRDNRFQDFIKNEVLIEGIDFHYDLERVYFVDGDRGDLKQAHKDNNGDEVADNLGVDNLYSPYYVALDWVANNLYFTDHGEAGRESGRFRRAAIDLRPKVGVISNKGNNFHWREAVIVADRLERPTGIAVNPRKGLLYWTDLGSTVNPDAKVEMAWMNGKNRKEIMIDSNNVEFRDFVQPTGLSIDFNSNDTVYFCDFRADVIGYFGWDGWNVRILANKETLRAPFSNLGSINPYQLDVFASQIYFTTKNTAANNFVIVMGKNATSDPPRELFSKPANTLGGIKVYHERRYPFGVPNPCEYAQCADMCVLTPPNENNVIYSGFDCICGSTGRDEVVVEGCEVDNYIPPKTMEPSSPNKPTTTQRSDCTTLGCFNSGTCQQTIGTCVCKTGFNGDLCQYQDGTNDTQQGDQSVVAYAVAAGVVFLILLLLVLAVFILVCYVKRKKRSAKPVVYRTGANVEIPGNMAPPAGEPVYESNLNPQPVTFENPGFGTPGAQAAGGDDPEKTGLPPDFADVLPEKVDLNYPEGQPGGMDNRYSHMPGPYPMNPPEPPPAYTEEELKK